MGDSAGYETRCCRGGISSSGCGGNELCGANGRVGLRLELFAGYKGGTAVAREGELEFDLDSGDVRYLDLGDLEGERPGPMRTRVACIVLRSRDGAKVQYPDGGERSDTVTTPLGCPSSSQRDSLASKSMLIACQLASGDEANSEKILRHENAKQRVAQPA